MSFYLFKKRRRGHKPSERRHTLKRVELLNRLELANQLKDVLDENNVSKKNSGRDNIGVHSVQDVLRIQHYIEEAKKELERTNQREKLNLGKRSRTNSSSNRRNQGRNSTRTKSSRNNRTRGGGKRRRRRSNRTLTNANIGDGTGNEHEGHASDSDDLKETTALVKQTLERFNEIKNEERMKKRRDKVERSINVKPIKKPMKHQMREFEFEPLLGKPSFRMLLVGCSETGKTTTFVHMYQFFFQKYFDVHVFSPTATTDPTWKIIHFPKNNLHESLTDGSIRKVMDTQQKKIKRDGMFVTKPVMFFLDDCAGKKSIMNLPIIREIAFHGRHFGISMIISTQALKKVNPDFRANLTHLILHQALPIDIKKLSEEMSFGMKPRHFVTLAHEAFRRDTRFLMVHMRKPDKDKFSFGFKDEIQLNPHLLDEPNSRQQQKLNSSISQPDQLSTKRSKNISNQNRNATTQDHTRTPIQNVVSSKIVIP